MHGVDENYCAIKMRSWVVIAIALWCHGWEELIKGIKGDHCCAGVGCVKLEQVGSLFWSMTKRGKKKVDRKNCTLEMTKSIEI